MLPKPVFTFNDLNSLGINEVPLNSLILIESGLTATATSVVIIADTLMDEFSTIGDFLADTSLYTKFDNDTTYESVDFDHDLLTNYSATRHYLQSEITEVGTITTGVWTGTAIDTAYVTGLGTKIDEVFDDKSPTLGGALDCSGQTLNNSSVREVLSVVKLANTTHTFDYSLGDYQRVEAPSSGSLTLAASNFISGEVCGFIIDIVGGGECTMILPVDWKFAGGSAPTYSASGSIDRFLLVKESGVFEEWSLTVVATDLKKVPV